MADDKHHLDLQGVSTIGKLIAWSAASRARTMILIGASLAATGAIDYATGYRYAFSPLYLFPVLVASTAHGRMVGMVVAMTAAAVWTFAQQLPSSATLSWRQFSWNVAMRFGVLGFIAWLLTALEQEMLAARRDYLTRLFNRRHFMRSLDAERSRSARTGEPFSVLSLDLDQFKNLNDTLGHAAGDEALRVVAAVLSDGARAMDVSARMGGDEFCVLLPGADESVGKTIARRLLATATDEFRRRGWPLGVSIGIATTRGTSETADELLRRADKTMYEEKQARRRGVAAGTNDSGTA